MGILKDFKAFAVKGNLADLAIGVVIGAAFGKVIASFVDGLVLPIVGLITQKDFSSMYYPLTEKVKAAVATAGDAGLSLAEARKVGPVFAYGDFVSNVINFLVIAFVCYMVIKNLLIKDPNAGPDPTPTE